MSDIDPPFRPPPQPLPAVAQGALEPILIDAYGSGEPADYWALNAVTTSYGLRLGTIAGTVGQPMEALVPRLLEKVWRNGSEFTAQVCRSLFTDIPWCRPMRQWMAQYLPQDLGLVTEERALEAERERARVTTVTTAFENIRKSADPELERQIAKARVALKEVSDTLLVLRANKSIHDTLHGLQTTAYPELGQLIGGTVVLSEAECDVVETQAFRLGDAILGMENDLLTLQSGESPDAAWLEDLRDACAPLSLQPPDRAKVETSLYGLRAVLRQQLPRFDAAIVAAAKSVPFGAAVAFLQDAANRTTALSGAKSVLDDAATKLEALVNDLNRAVTLHEAWQQVDSPFWMMEQELQPGNEAGKHERVVLQWRSAKRRLDSIRDAQDTLWDAALDAGIIRVAELLDATPDLSAPAVSAVSRFIRLARLAFLRVDKTVLAKCTQIGRLREPIEALLKEGD